MITLASPIHLTRVDAGVTAWCALLDHGTVGFQKCTAADAKTALAEFIYILRCHIDVEISEDVIREAVKSATAMDEIDLSKVPMQ